MSLLSHFAPVVFRKLRIAAVPATVAAILFHPLALRAASGSWNGTQDTMWTNSANWSASPFPSGSVTATFENAGNGNTSVNVDGLSTLLNLTFSGPSVAAYTIGSAGQKVTLLAGGTVWLAANAANDQTLQTALELPSGNSPVTFRNDNPAQTLTLGKVHGYTTAGATKSVYVQGSGPIILQGDLDRYASGLNLYHQSPHALTLNGNAQLTQLSLDGTNAVLNIASGKVMTFSNVGSYNILASQDSVINGPGVIVLSTNSGDDHANNSAATGKTLTINAKLTGDTGFQFWHESNYGAIVLGGVNDYTRSTAVNVPGTLQFSTIGNKGVAGNLGAGTNMVLDHASCRFRYTGAGETTDRTLDVKNGGILEHAGSGPLVFTAPTASSTAGNKTLTVRNFAAATGAFSGAVQNGSGTVSVTKEGDGSWSLSASNTFSGTLSVNAGTLVLKGADGAVIGSSCTVAGGATLLFDNTAAANNTNRLNDAATVSLSGGTLRHANDGGDAEFGETVGTLSVVSGSSAVTVDQAAEAHTAILRFAALTRSGSGATVDFTGTGLGESDRCRIFISGHGEGLIGAWATVNGTQTAFYDAARGVCEAPTWAVTNIAARGPDAVVPDDASADVRITEVGESGAVTLAGDPVNSVATLRQYAATSSVIATASKTLRAYGIGIAAAAAPFTLGENAGDGAVIPLTTGGTLALDNEAASTLTLNAALADNGTASSFAKSGDGDVIVAGPTLHTGTTAINGGALIFGGNDVTQRLAGAVTGCGTLVKTGTNLLDLAAANTFTGPAFINQGIVRVSMTGALGTTASGTVIADGATLDVGGSTSADTLDMRQEPVTVQGVGADGAGAVVNRSAHQQINALGKVTLAGDTTFGGSARWDIRDGSFKMNDHTVTKTGAGTVSVSGSTAVTPGGDAAALDVQEGTLRVQQTTQLGGSALNTVHLHSGTTLDFYDLVSGPAWGLVCDDNTRYNVDNSSGNTQNRWGGPVTLNGTLYLTSDGSFDGGFAGTLSGAGSLFKTNDHNLHITGTNNTYSGPTRAVGGWLYVNSLRNVGLPSSLGQPMTVENGTIQLGGGGTPGRIVYRGTGGTTDRVIDMAGVTGWTTLGHEGTGPLVYSNLTVSTAGAKILYLIGSSTSTAEIVASVVNSSSGNTTVEKQNAGTWLLSGDCTYSGNTTVQDGKLVFVGNNTLSGATTLNKGLLEYRGTNALAATLDAKYGTVSIVGTNTYGSSAGVYVGNLNNGILKLPAGARLACANNFRIGQPGGSGAFYLDGGTFTNAQGAGEQNFNFGCEANSYGYLLMTGGSVSAARLQTGGYSGGTAFGTAVLRIQGGLLTFPDWVILGRRRGGKSAVTLDGGTLTHTGSSEFALCRNGGDGEVSLTGGTLNNTDGPISYHSLSAEGTGVVNLCAGRLNARYFRNDGGAAYLMLSGGTLAPSADTSTFVPANMTGVYSFGAFGGFAGGAVIDTAGKAVAIPAAIRAPTGQSVTAIALASQGSGYIGEPYVLIEGDGVGATAVANLADDGTGKGTFKIANITLTCPGVNYTAAPTVTLRGGGTNSLAATVGAVTLAANAGGGLTKTGEGTLTLSGANTYAGTTTVSNGTLRLASAAALPAGTDLNVAGGTLDLGGFARTNGAVTASSGMIANGSLKTDRFTKSGDGSLTLATLLEADAPIVIQSGTLSLVTSAPGLYEGLLNGSFNTTGAASACSNVSVQLSTRVANVNTFPPWVTNGTFVYTGYLWNREATNVTWTFGENIDDSTLLKIDGATVLNNSVHNIPTIGTVTLAPGAHAFEARFGNGGGGAGRYYSAWWTTSAFGFGVDYLGRNETNIANFVALTDPGDGSLLTVSVGGLSNQIAAASSVEIASGAVLDLAGTAQTLASLSGSGIVSNGTLSVTGDILPGGDGILGTLTLGAGGVISGNLLIDVTAGGDSDRLAVEGDLVLANPTLVIANPAALDRSKVYTILTCSGSRTGAFASVTVPDSRWHPVYRADGSVQLLFTNGTLIKVR
jgi:autotransporter-associated beta strand protein